MHTPAPRSASSPAPYYQTRVCRALAVALVACFLASVARFYHPRTGFTSLIGFAEHAYEVPAMADAPHHDSASGGYDGQFYAQLALVPLLDDPAIDRALDNPAYRARRILFSWTAYAIGLGRPAWIVQAYALQNVLCWMVLAVVLLRWIPPDTPRGLALWTACLFSQGMLTSVRLALTDGPSLLLLALAAAAAERGRSWTAALVLGAGGLARETNLFGLALLRLPRRSAEWVRAAAMVAIAVLPLLLWQDYLWSIYRSTAFVNQDLVSVPFSGLMAKWTDSVRGVMSDGMSGPYLWGLTATLGLTVQAAFVATRFAPEQAWWRLAAPFVALMCVLDWVAWGGFPGAAVRVLLPMTIGFNVLLAALDTRAFWIWYAAGNAALAYAPALLRP